MNDGLKVEQKTMIGNQQVTLEAACKNIKFYVDKEGYCCYVVNNQNKVIATITADCAQNQGFLEVKKVSK